MTWQLTSLSSAVGSKMLQNFTKRNFPTLPHHLKLWNNSTGKWLNSTSSLARHSNFSWFWNNNFLNSSQEWTSRPINEHAINNLAQKKIAFLNFLTNLFKKKRQPAADHILVCMLSDERRKQKPYAIPVWYIPYHTLKDQFVREFTVLLKQEMAQFGLKAIGKVFSCMADKNWKTRLSLILITITIISSNLSIPTF